MDSSVPDSACGYAASTLMDADAAVLTVEFKVNLLEPAVGDRFIARGRVARRGESEGLASACSAACQRQFANDT